MELARVVKDEQVNALCELAREIWLEYFTDLLPMGQTEYMLEKFLSVDAVKEQMTKNYHFYILYENNDMIGFISYILKDQEMFVSKLYVKNKFRGQGFGKFLIKEIKERAKNANRRRITLSVNKKNKAVDFYKKHGFKIYDKVKPDIGQGYFMDDYLMEFVG